MRKAVRAFFQTACETVKHRFPCHDSDKIQPPTPDPDLDNSETMCLSDQVCPDLEPSPVEESPSKIEQAADDSDVAGSVSSLVPETPEEESSDPETQLPQGELLLLWFMLFLPCFIVYLL